MNQGIDSVGYTNDGHVFMKIKSEYNNDPIEVTVLLDSKNVRKLANDLNNAAAIVEGIRRNNNVGISPNISNSSTEGN